MEKQLNITAIKEYLLSQIKGSGWDKEFFFYLKSEDLDKIFFKIREEIEEEDVNITPKLKYLFKPFKLCPTKKVKVVILYPEPTPLIFKSDGMALSSEEEFERGMKFFQEEINRTVYGGKNKKTSFNLDYLATQGVLLLNLTPTARLMVRNSHTELWKEYTQLVMDILVRKYSKCIFVIMGDRCDKFTKELIKPSRKITYFKTTDPYNAPAGGVRKPVWDSGDLFNKINEKLASKRKKPIAW